MEKFTVYNFVQDKEKIIPKLKNTSVMIKNSVDEKLWEKCINECLPFVNPKACFMLLPVTVKGDDIDFEVFKVKSAALAENLEKSKECVLFGATIGAGIDRIIAKYSVLSPSKALIFQTLGADFIESLCDELCNYLSMELKCSPAFRFSPGYADLNIEYQKEISDILDLPKNCGITLTEELIMRPSKSVTAFFGINNQYVCKNKCKDCKNAECLFKK